MGNVLIANFGTLCQNVISTCLLQSIRKEFPNSNLYWICKHKQMDSLLEKHPLCKVISPTAASLKKYEYIFNLHPDFLPMTVFPGIEGRGFSYTPEIEDLKEVSCGESPSKTTGFQFFYKIAGMKWRGEGYSLSYKPDTKPNATRAGLAISNANLRNYVIDNLDLKSMRIWHVPYKRNIVKRIDEINRCKEIVTDDMLTCHLAISLRKYVHFLKVFPLDMKIEFFGNGKVLSVPARIVQDMV